MARKNFQLTMAISFIYSKDSDETRTMHTRSNNGEIMIGSETDEIIEDLLDPPKWLKNKGATINPQNKKEDQCFQYALAVALNCKKI